MTPERARQLIANKKNPAVVKRRVAMLSALRNEERREESRLNTGRWTVRFTGDDRAVSGLDSFEDCLQLAQKKLGAEMDWEGATWSDGLPPMHEVRCFHVETNETVALFFRDYK